MVAEFLEELFFDRETVGNPFVDFGFTQIYNWLFQSDARGNALDDTRRTTVYHVYSQLQVTSEDERGSRGVELIELDRDKLAKAGGRVWEGYFIAPHSPFGGAWFSHPLPSLRHML